MAFTFEESAKRGAVDRTLIDIYITGNYSARAAAYVDSTRLASFANGAFLPSAMPVEGQDFFGAPARANLQATGSAVQFSAYNFGDAFQGASANVDIAVDSATLSTGGSDGTTGVALRRVVVNIRGFTIGLDESAFGDPYAVPETIDIAGPNGRVTIYDAGGAGKGQGKLSYDFFSKDADGFKVVGSIEQAVAELSYNQTPETPFSYTPDFVIAPQYVVTECVNGKRRVRWHVKSATVFRSLALETPTVETQSEFGWGTALSGSYGFFYDSSVRELDRFVFSIAYGEGISHYLADLNAAKDTGDAAVNAAGELQVLPALAWYCGYTHNWTNTLRSTITYSHVNLDSVVPRAPSTSPYRKGNYLAINLMRHIEVKDDKKKDKRVFFGTEYLYGRKETLDGAEGDAHRVMVVLAVSK